MPRHRHIAADLGEGGIAAPAQLQYRSRTVRLVEAAERFGLISRLDPQAVEVSLPADKNFPRLQQACAAPTLRQRRPTEGAASFWSCRSLWTRW